MLDFLLKKLNLIKKKLPRYSDHFIVFLWANLVKAMNESLPETVNIDNQRLCDNLNFIRLRRKIHFMKLFYQSFAASKSYLLPMAFLKD